MDMTLSPRDWHDRPGNSSTSAAPRPLDWHSLAARLAAAAACRGATGWPKGVLDVNASFDPVSARRLAGFAGDELHAAGDSLPGSSLVNRDDSVESKPPASIAGSTAGTVKTGDRGLA